MCCRLACRHHCIVDDVAGRHVYEPLDAAALQPRDYEALDLTLTFIVKRSESLGSCRHMPSAVGDWPLGVLNRLWL